ncbi:MAG: competence/damage-inducible protein A [Vicinamibacterales bacterium]
MSTAEIIAVGTELLTPFRSDTNSLFLTARLNDLGIVVRRKSIVGDDAVELGRAVREALTRVDLLVVCGGLGPTDDDRTRETVADVLGRTLTEDASIVDRLRTRFAARGWTMPDNNRRQALVPDGAVVLENPRGTAPGLWLDSGDRVVVLLPGPPRELEPMFTAVAHTRLSTRAVPERLYRRVLQVAGRGESHVEELTQPIYTRWEHAEPPVATTVLASPGLVELHLSTRAASQDDAQAVLDAATDELAAVLGNHLFSTDGRSLSEVVGELLQRDGFRVAVGESCTGGLVTARLVDVPGSSRYVETGVIAYSDAVKRTVLGVAPELLKTQGAVSEAVAVSMAEGVRRLGATDIGVGVTGVAGPGGGSDQKPVGTVCFGVVGPGSERKSRTARFPGDRVMVRRQATQTALDLLRRVLLRRARERATVRGD